MRAHVWSMTSLLFGTLLAACESYPSVASDASGGAGGADTGDGGTPGSGGTVLMTGGSDGMGGSAGSGSLAVCGNGELEAGELCEDGGTEDGDGCSADCLVRDPDFYCPEPGEPCEKVVNCGSGVIEGDEACDDGNELGGDGCAADCSAIEDGWACPRPGRDCVAQPVCGNGMLERGESCDDLNDVSGDGCSGTEDPNQPSCQLESGFWCPAAGEDCAPLLCGDGLRSPDEQCDDGDTIADDGCSANCSVEDGWLCAAPGARCIPICGDGILRGREECDDGDRDNADGCNAACRLEPDWVCLTAGEDCDATVCGNGKLEPGEGCDDGNLVAADGCGATCQEEPTVTVGPEPEVNIFCGDGMVTGAEECDDGNDIDGDGCSAACTEEEGFTCTSVTDLPESVSFQVTYRDFTDRPVDGGHPHMRRFLTSPPDAGVDRGIPGAVCDTTNQATCGRLDLGGKPALDPDATEATLETDHPTLYSHAEAFSLWYRSPNTDAIEGENGPIDVLHFSEVDDYLTLTQQGGADSDVYSFGSSSFFPLDGRGHGDTPSQDHNFHFTTELRYFFQYQGGETLIFRGDDDVFVYVNGRLAVDIGGIHGAQWARVVLGDDGDPSGEDSDCSESTTNDTEPDPCTLSPEEEADADDTRFGLTKGGVYEIVLFHAERQPVASNFFLTLAGFLAPRSYCTPNCGDGQVVGWEVCDDGADQNTGEYDHCDATCTGRTFCGDAIRQGPDDEPAGPEACDDGYNAALYAYTADSCAPECTLPPYCGDGNVDAAFELCDNGAENADDAYEGCRTDCTWGPFCGDGELQEESGEKCDDGADNTAYSATRAACGFDCQPAPYCGDGVRNGPEQCDEGTDGNTGEYGGCKADCTRAPYCGDEIVQRDEGEECDAGPVGSLECSTTCKNRSEIH